MNDELKAKLYMMLDKYRWEGTTDDTDKVIAQIQQAYQEAGYSQYKVHDSLKDQTEVEVVHPKVFLGKKMPNIMTGQEWYERFEYYLKKVNDFNIGGQLGTYHDDLEVLEAARRAARLGQSND